MRAGGRDYRRYREPEEEEKFLLNPLPGKKTLVEKIYGGAGQERAEALDAEALEAGAGFAESSGAGGQAPPRPVARGTTPPPRTAAEQPFLPAEVRQYVQAVSAARAGSQWAQAAPAASAGSQWGQAKQPIPEEREVVAQRAPRRAPEAAPADPAPAPAPASPAPTTSPARESAGSEWAQARAKVQYVQAARAADGEVVATRAERKRPAEKKEAAAQEPAQAAGKPHAAGPQASVRVLQDFEAGEEELEGAEEAEIPEDLEGLDEEELDELAGDLDLELPEGATVEQKRKAIEAARASRQGKAMKGIARRARQVAADAAADQAGIEKKGKGQAAGRAAQGKAAAGAAKAAAARRSFSRAKNVDELKGRLRKVMEEDKAKFDELLLKESDALKEKLKGERDEANEELKALDQKMAAEIAAKEKEVAAHIEKKRQEAKARAEKDRKEAQSTTEAEKQRRRDEAAGEARRIESEAAGRAAKARGDGTPEGQAEAQKITAEAQQAAAAARSKGDAAAQELDGKLATTLDKIAKAEVEGAAELDAEKEKLLKDARARAQTAHDEGKARVDAAIVKINEQEQNGLKQIKEANEALRKKAQEKFDAQMKKLESGNAAQLAELEAETNKIIGEIDQEVLKFQAVAQQQTQMALQASKKAAQAAVEAIRAEGKKAIEQIDGMAKRAMERIDTKAAEMAARQAAVASEGQRRLTATTPDEAAQVEREAADREKAEQEKVEAAKAAEAAEQKKIDDAAAEIADELDDTFVDEDAILNHLRGKSPEEIARIKDAYFIKTGRGKNLDKEVANNSALDETERREAKAHLSGDPVDRAVSVLANAEDGWTDEEDEQRIKETLSKLDPETRKKVAAEFEKRTGRRLSTMVADELDAEDREQVRLEDPKTKKEYEGADAKVNPVAVSAAVAKIKGATVDDNWGTEEEVVVEALRGKTPAEIEAIRQEWDRLHAPPTLDQVLEDEMSGTELKEAKAMLSDDPVQQKVAALRDATDGLGTNKEKVQQTLESIKDPVLRAQVAAEFENQTGEKLDVMLVDELSGRDLDKAQAAAAGDVATLRAVKFDEAKNSNFLGDLSDTVADTMGWDRETMRAITDVAVVVGMVLTGPVGLLVGGILLAHEHIDLRDDENAMYKALEECETPEERKAMEAAFNKKYAPKTLRGEIGTLDGAEVDVATALLDGDKTKARAAKVKAGSEQFGWADKDLMFKAIQECESKEERDAMIAEFNRNYGAAAGGKDYEAMLDETFEPGSLDREKAKQLTEDGKMDDAFAYYYAMKSGWMGTGIGTDTAEMKRILARMSKEDIAKLNGRLKEVGARYGDPDIDIHEATADETSGREGKELEILLRGAPTSVAQAQARIQEMADFEQNDVGGWAIDAVVLVLGGPLFLPMWLAARAAGVETADVARGAVDIWSDSDESLAESMARLRAKAAEIDRTMKRNPGESQEDFEKRKLEAFQLEAAKEEGYLKNYQDHKDTTAEAAQTAVSLVVTAGLSIATGGAYAWVAALAGGLTGIAAKAGIAGRSYSKEELAMDLLEVAAEAVAAGLTEKLQIDKALKGLKALGVADDLLTKIVKEALEEAIENGASEFILALFDPDNYKSPEAFLFGVGGAVLQAALSGAAAAAVTVALGELWNRRFGDPTKIADPTKRKAMSALKGAVTEGIGGFAAAAVDPATWEGDMEAVLTRFGKGFIDNILSAGAEGIGDAVDAADHAGKVHRNRKRLADQGVANTRVVSGHILDLDSGRVFDGENGKELGRIAVDPATGEVIDVTDPSNPVRIGINEDLVGVRVGGVDTNAQAGTGDEPSSPDVAPADPIVDPEPDVGPADPIVDPEPDVAPEPSVTPDTDQTQEQADEDATANAEADDGAQVERASVEKARAILADMEGDVRPGKCLDCATKIATKLVMNGVNAQLMGNPTHFFLQIGDTIIDGSLHQFFDLPEGFSAPIFIGTMSELRTLLDELAATHGIKTALVGDLTVDELFETRFASATPNGMVLDFLIGKSGRAFGEFKSKVDRGAGRIDADFPILAASLDPDVGFEADEQQRARAALEGLSDTDYIRMRTLVNAAESDVDRATLLKALADGNSLDDIALLASRIHGENTEADPTDGAPPVAGSPLPLLEFRKDHLPFLLTPGEKARIEAERQRAADQKAFKQAEAALDATGRRTADPAVIVTHQNVLVDLPPLTVDKAVHLMQQLAAGNSHGLRDHGIAIPMDFDSKSTEWGLAILWNGAFGIIRGGPRQVDHTVIPEVRALPGHTHPLTADRQIDAPTHVSQLLIGDLQWLLQPSGRGADISVARDTFNHTIFLPYQHLGGGMIGQTTDNVPNQPHNGLDILRPPGIEVVLVGHPLIVGVHHTDGNGNPHPVFVVTIQIQAGSDVLFNAEFGVIANSQWNSTMVTELSRMPLMVQNAAAEHQANMKARGLGDQVGPIDGLALKTAGPNTPLGFSVLDPALAQSAFERIANGDPSGLADIGMFTENVQATPTNVVYALAQLPTGAFAIVMGGPDGVALPPWLIEVTRLGPTATPAVGTPAPAASAASTPIGNVAVDTVTALESLGVIDPGGDPAIQARIHRILNELTIADAGELAQLLANQAAGRAIGLEDWLRWVAEQNKSGADLVRTLADMRQANRMIAEDPGATVKVGGDAVTELRIDPATGQRWDAGDPAAQKAASLDLERTNSDGVVESIEITRPSGDPSQPPTPAVILEGVRHTIDKVQDRLDNALPVGQRIIAVVELPLPFLGGLQGGGVTKIAIDGQKTIESPALVTPSNPTGEKSIVNIFTDPGPKGVLRQLAAKPGNRLIHEVQVTDLSANVLVTYVRNPSTNVWSSK